MWNSRHLDCISQDVRLALRSFRRSPAFIAIAITSLALGIGANAAIFSFVNAILLKRLPVPEPNCLITFAQTFRGETSGAVFRMATIDALAKRSPEFSGLFGWFAKPVSFSKSDTAQWLMAEMVTGQYFETLEVKPAIGRLFTDDDVRNASASPVCVISYNLWQREFAGDPGAVGATVFLNGHPYRVLGVTQRGFSGAELQHRFDLQIPATRIGDFMPAFGGGTAVDWLKTLSWLSPMARLKAGVTRVEAQQKTQLFLKQIDDENSAGHASDKQPHLLLQDGSQGFSTMRSEYGRPVLVLMAIVGLVLLVTCANLANLLLARAQARAKEFAVRLSIGASRPRLIRQLLVESLVLATLSGTAGFLLSVWLTGTLMAFLNAGRSAVSAIQVQLDTNVVAFSIALSFVAALFFGLIPALQTTRVDLAPGLRQEVLGGSSSTRGLVRRSLVVVQIVLSLVVIFAAGLLTQTLRSLQTIDLGFRPDRVIALIVDPAANGHSNAEISRMLDDILHRVRTLPGVKAASLAASTPSGSMAISLSVEVPGYTPKGNHDGIADFNFVSPAYFATVGQPLLRGRDFSQTDDKGRPRVAIVNQKFVARYWRGQDPIGRKFRQGGGDIEIVGLVKDARDRDIRGGASATVYLPEKQGQTSGLTLLIRSDNDPNRIIPSLLAIVKTIDRRMPVYSVHTLNTEIDAGLSTERILGYLSGMFAALATLLAGIGLYGVLAYSVARRTREIGIRLSVGAQKRDIGFLFARESLLLVFIGLLVGGPAAILSVQALRTLLFGVTAGDPVTLCFSVLVLLGAALLATVVPLWRATRVSPLVALRYE